MASRALHPGLFWDVDIRYPRQALRGLVPDRRPDCAGRRTRLLSRRLAGRRRHVSARRHWPPAPARPGAGSEGMRTLITLLFIAAAASASADSPLFTSRAAIGSLSGEQIYDHICQGCHMSGALGAVGA